VGPSRSRSLRLLFASGLSVLSLVLPSGALVQPAQGATVRDLLPDLRMATPRSIQLQMAATESGPNRRLLRFSGIIVNTGEGPLVVKGSRACSTSACPTMTTRQRIRRTNGIWRVVTSAAVAKFDVGDGHRHWHVLGVERYELFQVDPPPEAPGPVQGAKVGFCFFDTTAWNLSLPRAPRTPVYRVAGCGSPSSTSLTMGLSVGWGDLYRWSIARQWIDTTDLPLGRYLLCSTANPAGEWRESNVGNNQSWGLVELYQDEAGVDKVRLLASNRANCASQLPPEPPPA
jgi:hypothetical protein